MSGLVLLLHKFKWRVSIPCSARGLDEAMIRPRVKPLLTTSYTEMAGRLILDLPEELVAELYVYHLVRKFQGRLKTKSGQQKSGRDSISPVQARILLCTTTR